MYNALYFDRSLAKHKPNIYRDTKKACPFCDKDSLKGENGILAEEGSILLVRNKFPTLAHTNQLVLIESDRCEVNLSTYEKSHLYQLVTFAIDTWLETATNPAYQSVLLFKNHGLLAGGSIPHAHMQIVGLEDIDYRTTLSTQHFVGHSIVDGDVSLNLSTFPKGEFFEFNIRMKEANWKENVFLFSDLLQQCTHYILHHLNPLHQSFNLFFYQFEGDVIVKVVSRYVCSAFFLGYDLHQVPKDAATICDEFTSLYLQKNT